MSPSGIAIGLLAGAMVYVSYYPSDSVAVEKGDALWLAALALVIATIAWAAHCWNAGETSQPSEHADSGWVTESRAAAGDRGEPESAQHDSPLGNHIVRLAGAGLMFVPWMLALWMMLAAFQTSPPGNLRMATNEAWFWVTAACIFIAARVLLVPVAVRQNLLGLIVICACGLAVHGMHQYFISLPANRAEYLSDPDAVIRKAMLDAPPGSSERMVFENRLMDGGPTATFALANSLAGVLLVAVILAAGMLILGWGNLAPLQRLGWGMIVCLCAGCMLAARSRSATLAMLIGLALLLIGASRILEHRRRVIGVGLLGLLALAVGGTSFLALFGNREWFEEAPASLAFRFQYWRATWQMMVDHPLFGAGPGNFQSMYERYREASATEQIAEPHNLFVETLASGGFVALGLLVFMCGCMATVVLFRQPEQREPIEEQETQRGRWVWLGAIVSFCLIWALGWISRQPPDLDASLFVVPAVLLGGWMVASSTDRLTGRQLDVVSAVAVVAIGIHLMISGGWTVPGVAMVIWLCAGMLVREPAGRTGSDSSGTRSQATRSRTVGVVVAGACLLLVLWTYSLRPVEQQRLWMVRAADSQNRGQGAIALGELEAAVAADPWAADAVLWLADFYRWRLVRDGESLPGRDLPNRDLWEAALTEAKRRAGDDPAVYRMIGAQQLHVFQKLGERRDLEQASRTFESALSWSPANQWMFAQMAVIDQARGDPAAATLHAEMARSLSLLGGNIERALSRQMVYIPRHVGSAADQGPIRAPADELLSEPNAPLSRIRSDRPPGLDQSEAQR